MTMSLSLRPPPVIAIVMRVAITWMKNRQDGLKVDLLVGGENLVAGVVNAAAKNLAIVTVIMTVIMDTPKDGQDKRRN